jgi:ferredoxin
MPHFITKSCTNCGACLQECPTGAIIAGRKQHLIDSDACDDHGACVAVCPDNAIIAMKIDPRTGAPSAPVEAEAEI